MSDKTRLAADVRSESNNSANNSVDRALEQTDPRDMAGGGSWVEEAISTYESALLRYAQHFVGDVESARDVVQDTFLQLCRNANQDIRGRLPQWLYTVCRNRMS